MTRDILKSGLMVLTLLLMLPWGAYAASYLRPSSHSQGVVAPLSAASAPALPSGDATLHVETERRCRGPAQVGSPCGVHLFLPDAVTMALHGKDRASLRFPRDVALTGRLPHPPPKPPRRSG